CAKKGTADQACDAMCNWLACDRARDDHLNMGNQLGICELPNCGFDFDLCVAFSGPHVQWINVVDGLFGGQDDFYILEADCSAHSVDPSRPDGLFDYLDALDGVPNARGSTAQVTDVVQWCIDKVAEGTGGGHSGTAGPPVGDGGGADTTAGSDPPPPPPPLPERCGPWARQRNGANPTDNFGSWDGLSEGSGFDGVTSHPVDVFGGGVEYSVMRCHGVTEQDCLRIDRLSVRLVNPAASVTIDVSLLERTDPFPIAPDGSVELPIGSLKLGARYEHETAGALVHVSNSATAQWRVEPGQGTIELLGLEASSDGELQASLSLRGSLLNTQPRPAIVVAPGGSWNEIVLSASTVDAELDPVTHRWMVLGHGSWTGDEIELSLPAGRHAVVLYADDVHGARGIAATWVEIGNGEIP
ncbi:MAG: hypothetical protein AB1Z98_25435, partial [Nannocystaceae bacterium]